MDSSAPLPKKLRQYEISELLSNEGKLKVYRAFDTRSQRNVTLKTISADMNDRDVATAIGQFKTCARIASELHHPGILDVYEYGEDDGISYLALEFVEGCYLKPRLRLPIQDAGSALIQLLEALDYAHRQNVLHLGIHPGCILLTSKGQLRITDFGVGARRPDAIPYSAPELLLNAPIDARSDVFSAGAWFYALLTGQVPFGDSLEGLTDRICHDTEMPPSQVNSRVLPVFDPICAKALAKHPAERYASAHEFAEQLRSAFEESYSSAPKTLISSDVVVSVFLSTLRGGVRASRSSRQTPPLPARHEASGAQNSNTVWADQTLRAVEKQLARYIGPVARVVVKNASARSKNIEDLYQIVAESLSSDQERRAFLEGHVSDPALLAPPAPQPGSEDPTIGNHDRLPIRSDVLNRKRPAPPVPPIPPVRPAVESPGMKSDEIKPRTAAAAKPSPAPDSQVIARLEEIIGKQPENLAAYSSEGSPDIDQVIYGFLSATEALSGLYASGGKTGGLTPQTIRFDRLGKASIQPASSSTNLQGATSFGSMGSPRYAAPEMFKESGTGGNSPAIGDIYALGFMFYEILLGRRLFNQTFSGQRNDLEWLRWHSDNKLQAPTLKSLIPGRPAALSDLLQSMMEKEPDKRISELAEIVTRLRSIAQQSSRTVVARKVPTPGVSKSEPSNRSKPLWVIALIILGVLLLTGVLAWQVPQLRQMILPGASQPIDAPDRK